MGGALAFLSPGQLSGMLTRGSTLRPSAALTGPHAGRTSVILVEPSLTGKGLSHEHLAKLFDVGNVIKMSKHTFFFWMRSSIV